MSKHHVICKSKTLDVPIIVTSTIGDSNDNDLDHCLVATGNGSIGSNKFKLDKGLSLDSHCLNSLSSSASSSTTNMTSSSSTSISSSSNSIRQQFLTPPSIINLNSNKTYNINADFDFDSVDFKRKNSSNEDLIVSSTSEHSVEFNR